MKTYSFYDPQTGLFTGSTFSGNPDHLVLNIPNGSAALEGRYDHTRQRVDLQSRRVVDDAELARVNAEKRREEMRADLARARIDELERKQLRPLRELQLDPNNAEAKTRLAEIDAQIAALRLNLGT